MSWVVSQLISQLVLPFFEVITFFGVAAFFAWLEFLTLLNDLATQFETSVKTEPNVKTSTRSIHEKRRHLVGICDFFLVSFLLYAIAAVADYLYHNGLYVGSYLVTLAHNPLLYIILVSTFVAGLITFLIPIGHIRSILRGDRQLWGKFLNGTALIVLRVDIFS